MKIQLTSIHVEDPIKAFEFYTEILGFVEQTYMPEAQVAIVVSPEDSKGTALLLEPTDNSITKKYKERLYEQDIPALVLSVADIETEYHHLKEAGVDFKKQPTKTEWGHEAIFDDTCGNYIQLVEA